MFDVPTALHCCIADVWAFDWLIDEVDRALLVCAKAALDVVVVVARTSNPAAIIVVIMIIISLLFSYFYYVHLSCT